jgi:hypothetical protein
MGGALRPRLKFFTNKRTWYLAQCTLGCGVLSVVALGFEMWGYAIFCALGTAVCAALARGRVERAKEAGDW